MITFTRHPVVVLKTQIARKSTYGPVRHAAYALAERYDGELTADHALAAAKILVGQGVSDTNLRYEGNLTADLRIAAVEATRP